MHGEAGNLTVAAPNDATTVNDNKNLLSIPDLCSTIEAARRIMTKCIDLTLA
jgi:hypothetical protein